MTNCFVSRFSLGYYFYRHCDHVSPSLSVYLSSSMDAFLFVEVLEKLAKVNFSRQLCKAIAINLGSCSFVAFVKRSPYCYTSSQVG